MNKLLFSIIAVSAVAAPFVGVAETATPAPTASAIGENGPVRRAFRGALRRYLAFRDETPLTGEQRSQVREILEKHRGEIKTQITAMRKAQQLVRKTIADSPASETDEKAAADRVAECARSKALLRVKLAREIRPLLTLEQRQRVDATMGEFSAEIGKFASAL